MCDITPDTRTTFSKSLQSPGLAREFVHEHVCAEHGGRGAVALELLASELVTNAVLYGGAPITMQLTCSGFSMRIEVHHENRASQPCEASADDGLGLLLVDKVSHEWGTTPTPTGKTVWCTLRTGFVPQRRTLAWGTDAAGRGPRNAAVEEAGSGVRRRPTKLGS
ncbi:MAG TPA: ATP-binding protein [Nocardioidaceae bacterium]|nr:ATP-binding protein [Nocardioidaceae bacterium]